MWVRKKNGIFAMIYYWALKMEIEKRISGKVLGVTEFGCSELELLINASRAFGRSTYQGLYVIDLVSKACFMCLRIWRSGMGHLLRK